MHRLLLGPLVGHAVWWVPAKALSLASPHKPELDPPPSRPRCPSHPDRVPAHLRTHRVWALPPGNPRDSLRSGAAFSSHGTETHGGMSRPRPGRTSWAPRPQHGGTGRSPRPRAGLPAVWVMGAQWPRPRSQGQPVRPAVLTPLLQVLRLTTTSPAARPRRSWRLPAAVPTSPRCPRRPRAARRVAGVPLPPSSGWWGPLTSRSRPFAEFT